MSDPTSVAGSERPELIRSPVTAAVIGLAAGAFGALLGVGAGLALVPGLLYLLRLRAQRAAGTALVVSIPVTAATAFLYHRQLLAHHSGGLSWSTVLLLALGSVIGAAWGARGRGALDRWAGGLLLLGLGIALLASAAGKLPAFAALAPHPTALVALGTVVGLASGALGLGGGQLLVPALVLLVGFGQHLSQGLALAVVVPVSLVGAVLHILRGSVVRGLVVPLTLGGLLGVVMTVSRVFELPPDLLRGLFGTFLALQGLGQLASGRRGESRKVDSPE